MKKKELIEMAMETATAFQKGVDATVRVSDGAAGGVIAPKPKELRAFMDGVSCGLDIVVACSLFDKAPDMGERIAAAFGEWFDIRREREEACNG